MCSSLLGPRVVKGTKIRMPSRAATMDLLLTVVGVEPKERESPVELLFIMDTTWPQEAAVDRWNRITSSLPKFLHHLEALTENHVSWRMIIKDGCYDFEWKSVEHATFKHALRKQRHKRSGLLIPPSFLESLYTPYFLFFNLLQICAVLFINDLWISNIELAI